MSAYIRSKITNRSDITDWTFGTGGGFVVPSPTSRVFTLTFDTTNYVKTNLKPALILTSAPWELHGQYSYSVNGEIALQLDNIFPILVNPGYVSGDSFIFDESVHGIAGHVLTIILNDVVLPGGAGWTANIAASQPPVYPSTFESLGAIKLTSNESSWVFGTDGKLTLPAGPTNADHATTKEYVDTSISNLVDGAPELLDTLNELAAAIGDNANFVTDVTASIATKLPLEGGTLTGELILDNNPVVAMGAATKEYVDDLVNGQMIYSTDDVPEGSKLYYTDARVRDAISVGGSLSYDSEQGIISYTTPVSNISSLSDVDTITRTPVVGEALVWDGENWVPGASVTAVLADASLDGGSFD